MAPRRIITLFFDTRVRVWIDDMAQYPPGGVCTISIGRPLPSLKRWNDEPSTRAPPWRPRRGDAHPSLQQVTYQTSSNWEPLFASVLGVRSQTPVKSRMPQFAESDLLDLPDPFASEPKTHADLIQRQRFVLAEAEVETQDRRLS